MASDLTTKDILDRLDVIETRQSAERAAARNENRWLNILMLIIIAAFGGVQLSAFGISAKPSTTNTKTPEISPVLDQVPVDPAGNTSPNEPPIQPIEE